MNGRMKGDNWHVRDRFGMIIHWGLYSIPARGEWVRSAERIPHAEYRGYMDEFAAPRFDAAEWAKAAKRAGMRYAILTAKHHDGFCLFDSGLTDFKSTNTPLGRDVVAEYVEAFRNEGLKVGLYYSLIDWRHPAYPVKGDRHHPMRHDPSEYEREPFESYLEYLHGQIRELCANYGKIDLFWFDFSYDEMKGLKWGADRIMDILDELQPDALVNNRMEASGEGMGSIASDSPTRWSGDFVTPEQLLPPEGLRGVSGEPVHWEACVTMNDGWGYSASDFNYKSPALIVRKVVECVSKGGNIVVNMGPDATGAVPDECARTLAAVGDWMSANGEGVYGCGSAGIAKPEWGRYTRKGDVLYAHVFEPPIGALPLTGIERERIKGVRLLCDGTEIPICDDWTTGNYPGVTFVKVWPYKKFNEADTVLKIELKR